MTRNREGDHTGRFTLPDGRLAHGTLTLARDKPPHVTLRPESPTPTVPERREFPSDSTSESLMGDLDSNEEVVVGDVHLSEWFPDRFFASGRWAVVGLSVRDVPAGRWTVCKSGSPDWRLS